MFPGVKELESVEPYQLNKDSPIWHNRVVETKTKQESRP
jgi:hypothetical protein